MNVNFNIKLSEGNSVGNYNIYFDEKIESNLATLYNGGGKAENISYTVLSTTGVEVIVPDTTKNIIVLGVTCNNQLIIPVTINVPVSTPPNFCFTYQSNGNKSLNFTPSGTLNGKTKWVSDTIILEWNPFIQLPSGKYGRWQITIDNNTLLITDNVSDVPDSGWFAIGSGASTIKNLNVSEGVCPTIPLILNLEKTDNSCFNKIPYNGTITATGSGGSGIGYQYSIDGNTYKSWPTFENLAPGDFTVYVKDSEGTIAQNNITINNGGQPVVYSIDINPILTNDVSSGEGKRVVNTEWELDIQPALSNGVNIDINLSLRISKIINKPGDGVITNDIKVFKGNVEISPTLTTNNEITSTRRDCNEGSSITNLTNNQYTINVGYGEKVSGTILSTLELTDVSITESGCATKLDDIIAASVSVVKSNCGCCSATGQEEVQILNESLSAVPLKGND